MRFLLKRWQGKKAALVTTSCLAILFMSFGWSECCSETGAIAGVRDYLRGKISAESKVGTFVCRGEMLCGATQIPLFYNKRGFFPAWCGRSGILPSARELISEIRGAYKEGLHPEDYHLTHIEILLKELKEETLAGNRKKAERLGDLDLFLTDAFMLYSSHLLGGRVKPDTLHSDWVVDVPTADLLQILESSLQTGRIRETLLGMSPRDLGYRRLKSYLASYRGMAKEGPVPPVPASMLRKGSRGGGVQRLRTRLATFGDLQGSPEGQGDFFDGAVESAVRRFQGRHGLRQDGIVGKNTLRMLNISFKQRSRQIELNLERWRWISHDLGTRYVVVNIAGFTLQVVESGVVRMEMRVVVGKPFRRTPVFSGSMTYLVINPYWNVPRTLAINDILPHLKKDPTYLQEQGLRVFADWSKETPEIDGRSVHWDLLGPDTFPFRLRQDPGPKNALGRIKFMFPNKFSVYLHDTPSRTLFQETTRNFSSGCIRVEKPVSLAVYLLRDEKQWTEKRIRETIHSGKTVAIPLRRAVPVHLQYWTAWVDELGRLHFRDDIYDRDGPLERALQERLPAG